MITPLDTGDLLNRCHAARAYLADIKSDFDKAGALALATATAAAMEYQGVCIKELARLEALQNRPTASNPAT